MRYYLISLGCPKNTVDAEDMGLVLNAEGHQPVSDPADADVLLVNTCGFIESARAESIYVLNDLAKQKRPGQQLIATGCLSQRVGAELAEQVPGLDGILGTRRWGEVLALVERLGKRRQRTEICTWVGDPVGAESGAQVRVRGRVPRVALQGRSAYLKIAEGCSAPCAFCAIPLIKGPLRSRPMHDILADAQHLAGKGIEEIIVIAQDTTAYGQERGEQR